MEHKIKPISRNGIAAAISKVHHYRSLNEPEEAESICHDILAAQPGQQVATRLLGLAITDQFTGEPSDRYAEAESAFQKLTDRYERVYYLGILYERRAKAQLRSGHAPHTLLVLFEQAMSYFEQAERIRPPDNDESILRWNRCVRLLNSRPEFHVEREVRAFEGSDSPPTGRK